MTPITFAPFPILVTTPLGDGYIIYIKSNGTFDNDEVCVALIEGGQWRHFTTDQIKSFHNGAYKIVKDAK